MRSVRLLAIVTIVTLLSSQISLAARPPRTERPPALPPMTTGVPPVPSEDARERTREAYGRLPLSFEENRGQADPAAKFVARGPGYTALVASDGLVLALRRPDGSARPKPTDVRAVMEA